MYSLVILPEKTQLALGRAHKKYVSIDILKEYPSIFLPLVHKDKNFLVEFFNKVKAELVSEKDNSINVVLSQDLFLVEQVTYIEEEPALLQVTNDEIIGCQSNMTAYGDGKAWLYTLRKDIYDCLKSVLEETGFKINYVKSSTEVMFKAIGNLTLETFILSFARDYLDVDFVNGLTGLNKFSLPLISLPKDINEWDIQHIKEELNTNSKGKNTGFSHKIKANLNTGQKIYVSNSNDLSVMDSISNMELIATLCKQKVLKSELSYVDLSRFILAVGSYLALLNPKNYGLELPPGFLINDLNFNAVNNVKNKDKVISPKKKSTLRRFCKFVSILMLFALFFMGSSLYYFDYIKSPSNVEMAKYHDLVDENKKLKEQIEDYSKITGDQSYFARVLDNLLLDKLGKNPYENLILRDLSIIPGKTATEETVIKLKLVSSSEDILEEYMKVLRKENYFNSINLLSKSVEKVNEVRQDEENVDEANDNVSTVENTIYTIELKVKAGIGSQGDEK